MFGAALILSTSCVTTGLPQQALEKKEGLFRKNMMGKRVNFAARWVVAGLCVCVWWLVALPKVGAGRSAARASSSLGMRQIDEKQPCAHNCTCPNYPTSSHSPTPFLTRKDTLPPPPTYPQLRHFARPLHWVR